MNTSVPKNRKAAAICLHLPNLFPPTDKLSSHKPQVSALFPMVNPHNHPISASMAITSTCPMQWSFRSSANYATLSADQASENQSCLFTHSLTCVLYPHGDPSFWESEEILGRSPPCKSASSSRGANALPPIFSR